MTKKNSTKRALLMSALSLLLCFSMLIGTTFAWFTDSVSTTNNIIVAGNLDIELYYATAEDVDVVAGQIPDTAWKKVNGNTNVFKENLWEPGHTEVVYLKVVNEGTLSLKYHLGVNVESEITSTNVLEEELKLSDHIKYGVLTGAQIFTRDDAVAAVKDNATKLNQAYNSGTIKLDPKTATNTDNEDIVTMVVYMPTSVGNEANYKKDAAVPKINLGINLFATQVEAEEDSYGSDYDKDSWKIVYDEKGLRGAIASGEKNIKLGGNITLTAPLVIPSGQTISLSTRSVSSNGIVLDMGGFTLTMAAGVDAPVIINEGELQIQNGDVTGDIVNEGDLKIENTNVEGDVDTTKSASITMDGATTVENIIVDTTNHEDVETIMSNIAGATFDNVVTPTGDANDPYVEVAIETYVDTENNTIVKDETTGTTTIVPGTNVGTEKEEGIYLSNDEKTYHITNLAGLKKFAEKVNSGDPFNGKTVVLSLNIDLKNEEWTPIGNSTTSFQGTFDGNGKTISNLNVNMPGQSNVGFFGMTTNGTIKNLTIENAKIEGRLNVGVVAGTPYTSKYSNITVKGHVEVDGMAYVGGVGGKNAYADWTDITVAVDETSYVNADSVENGTAYRTYVGGVIGFMGEGGHKFTNVTSNIDVIGSTIDVGGITGIAHYGNSFINCSSSGDVTITNAAEAADAEEIGGIAGVWHNQDGYKVIFSNCEYTGKLTVNITEGVDLSDNTIAGKAYSSTGTGLLIVIGKDAEGNWAVTDAGSLRVALTYGGIVKLYADVALDECVEIPVNVEVELDLNGKTITGTKGRDADDNRIHVIVNNGILTIKDGTVTSAGVNGGSAIYNADGATLTVENVTLNGAPQEGSTWPSYTVNNYGTLTVSDSSIYGVQGIIATNNTANTTVNNVIAYRDGWSSGHVFYTSSTAKVTINGGTYTNDGNGVDGTMIYGGETVVNGGTFIVKEGAYFALCSGSKLTVNDGDFSNIKSCLAWGGTMTISGGTFGFNPTTYVADGYIATTNADGTYTVVKGATVANAADLKNAIAAGGNIVLTQDIVLTETLFANKDDVVLDLNGKTITAPANGNMFHSGSDTDPSILITSSTAGAKINITGGDTAVLLGYGSTVIKNVTINITGCDNYSPSPFNVYGDLTIGEGTVVNIDYLGSALISNNGKVAISIDGAKFNIGTFKRNGLMIDLNNATTFEMKNTTMKIDTYVLSQFGGEGLIKKLDGVTIENCTFDVTDSNGASCTFVADAGLGRYDLVQK